MHDSNGDTEPSNDAPGSAGEGSNDWGMEVLAPIRPAHQLLVTLIRELPDRTGVEVSISQQGSLVLNAKAWRLFCDKLLALKGIAIRHGYDVRTQPIKFLISE